ncbi:23469_t:CDS:2, partial [Gigaspora margarita]
SFNLAINKAKEDIEIAERNSFCPIPLPTGVQIGSNASLNIIPDTSVNDIGVCSELCNQSSTGSCNNRQHIFNSKNSSSFSQNGTKGSINYLDGSTAKGLFGNDFITLNNFGFANKFSFLLYSQIFGALQAESAVEGIMGLGLSSQIWDQLASKGYDQAIGFALPNSVCDFGSIAFGGIDTRFSKNSNEIFNIPTLNDSTYPKIEIVTIQVNRTLLDFPVIDAIISTNYDKVSLGNYSTEFFKALGATKVKGSWVVPNPVDISFDLLTDSGQIIQATISSKLTCIMIKGQCISVFDDSFVPSNSILIGIPFIQNYNFVVNKAKSIVGISDRSNFCPNPCGVGIAGIADGNYICPLTTYTSFTSTVEQLSQKFFLMFHY